MGNKPLWEALAEREELYSKAEMTDEDGMRLGELEGIVADEDGFVVSAVVVVGVPVCFASGEFVDPSGDESLDEDPGSSA